MRRTISGVLACLAVLTTSLSLACLQASPAAARPAPRVGIQTATSDVTEGDRVPVVVRVGAADTARRVELQEQQTDIYGDPVWVRIDRKAVHGRRHVRFTVVPTQENTERYRAVVAYSSTKPVRSRALTLTVWRWIPLVSYDAYYTAGGVLASSCCSFGMNGASYIGWKTYGTSKAWESRYTTGRNCKELTGDLGVLDTTDDGASAVMSIVDEAGAVLHQSGALTPGMVEPLDLSLDLPYRFAITAADTSPVGLDAYPAIGDPELLCTGV